MRRFLLIVLLFATSTCFSQDSSVHKRQLIANDSVLMHLQRFDDSVAKDVQEKAQQQEFERMNASLNSFAELQREQRAKQKRQTFIRIGIGVAFLILLIVGLRRRAKKGAK
jgi:hypothetical protein